MGNETDKKFTWVIKNFSSLGSKCVALVHSCSVNANGVLAPLREELTTLVVFYLCIWLFIIFNLSLLDGDDTLNSPLLL
ncbi:unnamed protein product [Brassica rapa subsp. trilocularis]